MIASTDIKYLASLPESFEMISPFSSLTNIDGFKEADLDEFFQSTTTFCFIPVDSSETSLKLIPSAKSSNSITPEDSVIIGIV